MILSVSLIAYATKADLRQEGTPLVARHANRMFTSIRSKAIAEDPPRGRTATRPGI